jgi:hypothetical protein
MGWSSIASSRQPVPSSNHNNNCTNITNMTTVENMGLLDRSTIVEGAMSVGGKELCQRSDLGVAVWAILFYVSSLCHTSSKWNRTDSILRSDLKCMKSQSWWCRTLLRQLNSTGLTNLFPQFKYSEPFLHVSYYWSN